MSYKVGDKFEIEIEEVYESACPWVNAINLYRIKGFNSLVFDENGLDKLKKIKEEPPKPKTVKASELPKDTVVLCKDDCDDKARRRYFAGVLDKWLFAYSDGLKSFESNGITEWEHMTLEDGTEVLAE